MIPVAAPAGEAPEYELVGDLLRKALPVAPVVVAVAAVFAGLDGALSAGVGVALVAGNLLLAAASLVWAGRISLGLLMGVALGGYAVRIGLLFLIVLVYALLFDKLGFMIATALMTVPVARFFGGSWKQGIVGGIGLGVGMFFFFDRLLDVALPTGLWLNGILG